MESVDISKGKCWELPLFFVSICRCDVDGIPGRFEMKSGGAEVIGNALLA